jgi:hypothetical protein
VYLLRRSPCIDRCCSPCLWLWKLKTASFLLPPSSLHALPYYYDLLSVLPLSPFYGFLQHSFLSVSEVFLLNETSVNVTQHEDTMRNTKSEWRQRRKEKVVEFFTKELKKIMRPLRLLLAASQSLHSGSILESELLWPHVNTLVQTAVAWQFSFWNATVNTLRAGAMFITFKKSVRTSNRTPLFTITKTN